MAVRYCAWNHRECFTKQWVFQGVPLQYPSHTKNDYLIWSFRSLKLASIGQGFSRRVYPSMYMCLVFFCAAFACKMQWVIDWKWDFMTFCNDFKIITLKAVLRVNFGIKYQFNFSAGFFLCIIFKIKNLRCFFKTFRCIDRIAKIVLKFLDRATHNDTPLLSELSTKFFRYSPYAPLLSFSANIHFKW